MTDNRWTKRCTEWQPRRGKRSRGRPSRRWQDDITRKEGTTWRLAGFVTYNADVEETIKAYYRLLILGQPVPD